MNGWGWQGYWRHHCPCAAAGNTPGAADVQTGFDALPIPEQEQWTKYAEKLINTHVQFIAEPKTAAELENILKNSPLTSIKGDAMGLVMYYFDAKGHGESETRPDLRATPLRETIYNKLVRSVLQARTPPGETSCVR